jgi:hypothetical protein
MAFNFQHLMPTVFQVENNPDDATKNQNQPSSFMTEKRTPQPSTTQNQPPIQSLPPMA